MNISISIRSREFLGSLSNIYLVYEDSALWNWLVGWLAIRIRLREPAGNYTQLMMVRIYPICNITLRSHQDNVYCIDESRYILVSLLKPQKGH